MSTMKRLFLSLMFALIASAMLGKWPLVEAEGAGESERYVHSFMNSGIGNYTYLEKPVFPVLFNDSQILVGQNWSIICPLVANHSYHVYCYGKWVNNGSEPRTDYDVYVYDPLGGLETNHTESAGLPEHLGTTVDDAFFVPKLSGNYTFVVRNDPRESKGAQAATFVVIENLECNKWHQHYVEGKSNESLPLFRTSWAYEFLSESRRIQLWVTVPDTLDMYEARIYLMANPKSGKGPILNGVPLAWEPGIYGNRSDLFGGYNLESKEYRGVGYASCEFHGQEMFLNFSSPFSGRSLYHLVFIGEGGSGTIEFLVKTEFGKAGLIPQPLPSRVYPDNDAMVICISNSTDLMNATLQYSTSDWANSTAIGMEILNNRTCRAVIPRQMSGTTVGYRIEAHDLLKNVLRTNGTYSVKHPTILNITLVRKVVTIGENLTVMGYLAPANADLPIIVTFASTNTSKQVNGITAENGTFVVSYRPETLGTWGVQARFAEDKFRYESETAMLTAKVNEPSFIVKYSLFIGGGATAAAVIGIIVYLKKFRQ